jgi:hypothetical protein
MPPTEDEAWGDGAGHADHDAVVGVLRIVIED